MPHYPEAYLESKHCKVFAHWQRPKGVSMHPMLAHVSHPTAHRRDGYATVLCAHGCISSVADKLRSF